MKDRLPHSAIAVCVCLLLALRAAGQSTRPVSAVDQASENQSLRISESEIKAATAPRPSGLSSSGGNASELSRIVISMMVVIGLILLLRSGVRRMTAMPIAGKGSKLVTVVSRSVVSPKQQVLVLQVGRRLLVVGDSGGQMSALCEISDPDEVAGLIGQSRQVSTAGKSAAFGNLFRRAHDPFTEADALQAPMDATSEEMNPDDAVSAEEVGGLLDKVRMLQRQFNESKPAPDRRNPV